jgi:hypothetical protein
MGPPAEVVSDLGPQFVGQWFKTLCAAKGNHALHLHNVVSLMDVCKGISGQWWSTLQKLPHRETVTSQTESLRLRGTRQSPTSVVGFVLASKKVYSISSNRKFCDALRGRAGAGLIPRYLNRGILR